jgi:Flp pilus assembly protein TadG
MARLFQRWPIGSRPASGMAGCRRGSMLIEFAAVFPILVMLLLGLVEFGQAFAVNRRLTQAAGAVSDLVAQTPEISTADLDDIARLADEILKPYPTAPMSMIVSSIETNRDGHVAVAWSYAHGGGAAAHQPGSGFPLPPGLSQPNSSVIVTETFYPFAPGIGLFLTGTIPLSGKGFFRPRLSRTVIFSD